MGEYRAESRPKVSKIMDYYRKKEIGINLKFILGNPDQEDWMTGSRGAILRKGWLNQGSREVSPSLMAYLVSSATLRIPSLCMICCRWVSTVFTLMARSSAI